MDQGSLRPQRSFQGYLMVRVIHTISLD
uniref:Uncharacterized protein n=1 Tax=Anguilla anguilla TaxID=7936 RepID=A0A0E9U1I6_ANGAN